MDALMQVLVSGLAVFFGATLIRALPWPMAWTLKKPLSCDVCMSGWCAIGLWVAHGGSLEATSAAAAAGLSLLLMKLHGERASWGLPPS